MTANPWFHLVETNNTMIQQYARYDERVSILDACLYATQVALHGIQNVYNSEFLAAKAYWP